MPRWGFFLPVTLSIAATVTATAIASVGDENGRARRPTMWLALCAAASLALLVLPVGLSSSTGCSDTGGSMHLDGTWLLGVALLLPVGLILGAAYAGAGIRGAEPWWRAAATVTLLALGSFVEFIASGFAVFAMCENSSLTLAYAQIGVAATVPVAGIAAARLRPRA